MSIANSSPAAAIVDDEPYVSPFLDVVPETTSEKFSRKIGGNPFVPLGLIATGASLIVGLWAFRTGRQQLSQNCQRARVGFQGLTVVALVGGSMINPDQK
eukprot:m.94526 g.94526  ORF g.94526 m.94526 type:complete len:100 (+) comp26729_c0_seq1:233-532(+)